MKKVVSMILVLSFIFGVLPIGFAACATDKTNDGILLDAPSADQTALGFCYVRENIDDESKKDLIVIMESKKSELKKYDRCEFSISLFNGNKTVKSKNYKADKAYTSMNADGQKYYAAEDCGLIACTVYSIPLGITSFSATAKLISGEKVVQEIDLGSAKISEGVVTLSKDEMYDKLLGGWLGQMIGVSWAASTEFCYRGEIMPEKNMPKWKASMINDAFSQDDLYVEIPFMEMLEKNGINCDVNLIADNFAKSGFPLWHANYQARLNLQNGIKYPDSGSPMYNIHADDIDWQIEADFLGMIYPGLVNMASERSFELGHIMNYGDGVYGGVFVSALHSAAYTAATLDEVIQAGLDAIPDGTLFKNALLDVVNGYNKGDSWETVWKTLEDKWASTDKCTECTGPINIDAKLNSAYVLIGLLYGGGDLEKTIIISTRCGQDSDCNPSTAASVLCNFLGASKIPDKYKSGVDMTGTKFQTTEYTLEQVLDLSMKLISESVTSSGGTVSDNDYTIVVPEKIKAVPFEQWEGGIGAQLIVNDSGGCSVNIRLATSGSEKIEKVTYDMGDGYVTSENLCKYGYAAPGTYKITCNVEGKEGTNITLETTVTLESELKGVKYTPICSVENPWGSGNKDMNVFCDGVIPSTSDSSAALQYDTYCGGGELDSLYVGMKFDRTVSITGVKFTEGMHFWDGGWFEKAPVLELLIEGNWVEVATVIDGKAYPDANNMSAHGLPFESYTFRLENPTECDGVRFKGKPGGGAYFISVSEITPLTNDGSVTINRKPAVICSVGAPSGGGSQDIGVICDGIIPSSSSANDKMQYDTYVGETPDVFTYIGYLFTSERSVSGLIFTEGNHFNNGGWFKNGSVKIQILTSEGWIDAECDGNDRYPVGDDYNTFAPGYQSYTFKLKNAVNCMGIRIAGTAGGVGFVSVSELEVINAVSFDSPVAHITFDALSEGLVFNDDTGNGNNAVANSTVEIVEGRYGKAVSLAGGQHIEIADSTDFKFSKSDSFTIDLWFKWSGTYYGTNWPCVIQKGISQGKYVGFWVNSGDQKLNLGITSYNNYPAEPAVDTSWHHAVVVQDADAGTIAYYYDDKLVLRLPAVDASSSGCPFTIGYNGGDGQFVGCVDELYIYDYAVDMSKYESDEKNVDDMLFKTYEYISSSTGKSMTLPYRLYLPEGYDSSNSEKFPVLLFLHGYGEIGNNNTNQIRVLGGANALLDNLIKDGSCVIIAPQCNDPAEYNWVPLNHAWNTGSRTLTENPTIALEAATQLLKDYINDGKIDTNRVYVSGISMGGYGTWEIIARNPELFAAAIPLCGAGIPSGAAELKDMAIWAFHGEDDTTVPVSGTRDMENAIKAAGGTKFKATYYSGVGHNVWPYAYNEEGLVDWLLAQSK